MASFLNRWVDSLKESAREEIQETARSASLYITAGVAGVMALVFLTLAGFWWLELHYGAITAALIVAGVYAAVAAIFLVWASWPAHSASSTTQTAAAEEEAATTAAGAAEVNAFADLPDKMGIDLDSVAGTLSDAGYRTEALIVTASKELLKQLTPLQFISLVFVGSFLFGRRLRKS